MAKTENTLKLSDILDNFNDSMTKVAEDEMALQQAAVEEGAPAVPPEGEESGEPNDQVVEEMLADPEAREALVAKAKEALSELASESEALEGAIEVVSQVEDEAGEAEAAGEVTEMEGGDSAEVEVADTLKALAAEVINGEDNAMAKEASEFGRIFAQSAMEEMETADTMQKIASEAYDTIQELLGAGGEQGELAEDELQKVAEDAYEAIQETIHAEAPLTKEAAEQIFIESFNVIKEMV